MNCFAHIFIGKEFEQLVQNIGRVTYKSGDSAASYMHYYLLDSGQQAPGLKKLSIESTAPSPELNGLDKYINVQWEDKDAERENLTDIYKDIYNDVLGGERRGLQSRLYVCIHFPFYKESAFAQLTSLYKAVRDANMPDKVSFVGYCADLAEMISPQEKDIEKLSFKAQVSAFRHFREKNNVLVNQHLLLFQNSFQNGIPLNLTSESLVEIVSLLLLQYVGHYDEFYPDTMAYSEAVSFGVSSISLDKYKLVDYLFCRTMIHVLDATSITDETVSVNEVFAKVRNILLDKGQVLSEYFSALSKTEEAPDITEAEKYLENKAESIISRCEEVAKENRSMPMKAAILAALLQEQCDFFHQMVFNPESPDLTDLFDEPINYFLEHDKSHFWQKDDNAPVDNPLKELKELNSHLINNQSKIKELQKSIDLFKDEIENLKSTEKTISFEEDGYYHVDDRRYRLLPNIDEKPLQETYVPHPVKTNSLDLRENFREIQDQGSQGSCVAFALTSIFEYMMRSNNRKEEYDLSEAFLYYNARKQDPNNSENEDCGSRFESAIESLHKDGIAVEALCKYNENIYDKEPSQEAYDDAKKRLLRKAVNVSNKVSDIKSALEDGFPVAASFTLCPSFSDISMGFVPMPQEEEISEASQKAEAKHSRHAMVIVGFDDKIQCFLVRNSWGRSWGTQGYCYMPYSYVENSALFNFACIFTEIESIESKSVGEIPTIRLDDTDVGIRYHMTLAALRVEQEELREIKSRRDDVLKRLEGLKLMFSDHTNCENYIKETCRKIGEEQNELNDKIVLEKELKEKENEKFQKLKKRLWYKAIWYSAGLSVLVGLYNWMLVRLAENFSRFAKHYYWVRRLRDGIEEIVEFIKHDHNYQLSVKDLQISWITLAVVLAVIFGILWLKGHLAWKTWREKRDEHDRKMGLLKKQIEEKQKEADSFRFNTQAVRKWLSELMKINAVIQQRYTKIISRINNLRTWYAGVQRMKKDITFHSVIPDFDLLDQAILDSFFERQIKDKPEFFIDFSENLDQHDNSEEYLRRYQEAISEKVTKALLGHPRLNEFNITDHIVSDTFTDMAKQVVQRSDDGTEISLNTVKCQSDIFMHINSHERGLISPSVYVITPSAQQNAGGLRKKFGRGVDSWLSSDNAYRMVMLQIVCIGLDECRMFQ